MLSSGSKNDGAKQNDSRSNSIIVDRNTKKTEGRPNKDRLKSLRILIVEPKGNYCKIVWCAIGVGYIHLLLGATVMTTLMYSIQTGNTHVCVCTTALCIGGTLAIILMYSLKTDFHDVHVILCTFGYHFFSAEAILSLNYANGWSSPLKLRHRRFAHVFLQMFALLFAVTGTAMVTLSKGITENVHSITGAITTVLSGITFLTGPCALFGGRYLKILHVSMGMPTFLISSVCLCFGIFTSAFRNWAGESVVFILLGFVTYYTSFIIISCFMKCVMRI